MGMRKHLEVDIDYMMQLPDDMKVTVYYSDAIIHIKGGWCTVTGEIYYTDDCYDRYTIRTYRKSRGREYYRMILNRFYKWRWECAE